MSEHLKDLSYDQLRDQLRLLNLSYCETENLYPARESERFEVVVRDKEGIICRKLAAEKGEALRKAVTFARLWRGID